MRTVEVPVTHRNHERILRILNVYKAADHEGYHHTAYDWWIFDARETNPKTCPICLGLHSMLYRGDQIPVLFPYHTHQSVNTIRAKVHEWCRCRLRWAGREEEVYKTPHGNLSPEEAKKIWYPGSRELEKLTPSQLKSIRQFLRNPWG